MKRILCLFLTMFLFLLTTACGDDTKKDDRTDTDTTLNGGVDVQDGVEVVFGPVEGDVKPTAEQLDVIKTIIEQRLAARNITDYEAHSDVSGGEVVVRFSWTDDQASAEVLAEELIQSGMVQFYEGDGTQDSNGYNIPPAANNLILDGRDVVSAEPMIMGTATIPQYGITLTFSDVGSDKFAAATKKLAGKGKISIWLDFGTAWAEENNTARYALLQAAAVNEAITGGEVIITGFTEYEEAKELAGIIGFGFLPFDIAVKNLSVISPTS